MSGRRSYEYVVLRCVPRVDRDEFVNVGVVVHCQADDVLDVRCHLDEARLAALAPGLDPHAVAEALEFVGWVCAGDERAGGVASQPRSQRFGYLKAPRSTVVQPGPVHGGLTTDPTADLDRLVADLVHRPGSN